MFIFKASSLSAGSAAKFFEDLSFLRNFPKTLFTITNLNNNKANPQLSALSHYCEKKLGQLAWNIIRNRTQNSSVKLILFWYIDEIDSRRKMSTPGTRKEE